jgi:hypothetical protein
MGRLSRKCGSLDISHNLIGLHSLLQGLLYLYINTNGIRTFNGDYLTRLCDRIL